MKKKEADEMKVRKPGKLSNALLFVLAISLLMNVALGIYLFRGTDKGEPEKPVSLGPVEFPKAGKVEAQAPVSSILGYDKIPETLGLDRTLILNALIERHGYTSYLEIGQGHRELNHDRIQCPIRIGVDPDRSLLAAYQMTSDDFFARNKATFDLIFVDGLHYAYQTEKDILNALKVLNERGTILVHDCNPATKEMQVIPRTTVLWNGDVWKAWVRLRATREDLDMFVIDADNGCGLIRRGRQATITIPERLSYEDLAKNRKGWLNLVDQDAFLKDLKSDRSSQ